LAEKSSSKKEPGIVDISKRWMDESIENKKFIKSIWELWSARKISADEAMRLIGEKVLYKTRERRHKRS